MVLPEKFTAAIELLSASFAVPFTNVASPASSAAVPIENSAASLLFSYQLVSVVPSHTSAAFSAFSRAILSSPLFSSSVGCSFLFSSSFLSPSGFSLSLLSPSGLLASSPLSSSGFLSSSSGSEGCSSLPSSVFLSSLFSLSSPGAGSAGFVSPSTMVVPLPSTTSVANAAGVTSVSVSTRLISRLTMRRDILLVRFFM